jgi:hypothetical protein
VLFNEETFGGAGYPGGPSFDGYGGSMAGQVIGAIKGGKKGGGDGEGDGAKPEEYGLFDDSMPGPPELVNPAPLKSFTLMSPLMSTRSSATKPGLKTTAGFAGLNTLSPGSSIRSKQIGGGAMVHSAGLTRGAASSLTGGARSLSGLKLSK